MPDIVLSIDTALSGCGVGLYDAARGGIAAGMAPMVRGHAEVLVPMIDELLARHAIAYADLGLIAVTVGPGAFTGLRIGLATAQALGLALATPVAGVTTTAVLAAKFFATRPLKNGETLAVVLETKRTDFYAELFGAQALPVAAVGGEQLATSVVGPVLAIGDALPRLFAQTAPKDWTAIEGFAHPDPITLAALAWADFAGGRAGAALPLYLRQPDVTLSTKPRRQLAERD